MCKKRKNNSASTIESIISDYFKADDYANDNLPDSLYWCIKAIVAMELLRHPITKGCEERDKVKSSAYHELFRIILDSLFLRLRQFTSIKEKYSGGRFIYELKNFGNLETSLESEYGRFLKRETTKSIKKLRKMICQNCVSLYGYKKDASVPKLIHEYEQENFHQDRHSDGVKYEIIGFSNNASGAEKVSRRNKPTIDLLELYDSLENISLIVLEFCKICHYGRGNILCDCNRYHDSLDMMIEKTSSIYNYAFDEELLNKTKDLLREKLPNSLELISRDVILG